MPNPLVSHDADTITARIPGDLISTSAGAVRDALKQLLDAPDTLQGVHAVVLDLRAAAMIDSVGLNLIVAVLRASNRLGASMKIIHNDPNVNRILLFTRLDEQLEIQRAA